MKKALLAILFAAGVSPVLAAFPLGRDAQITNKITSSQDDVWQHFEIGKLFRPRF